MGRTFNGHMTSEMLTVTGASATPMGILWCPEMACTVSTCRSRIVVQCVLSIKNWWTRCCIVQKNTIMIWLSSHQSTQWAAAKMSGVNPSIQLASFSWKQKTNYVWCHHIQNILPRKNTKCSLALCFFLTNIYITYPRLPESDLEDGF